MCRVRRGALVLIRGRFPKRYSTSAVLVWLARGWPAVRRAAVEGL